MYIFKNCSEKSWQTILSSAYFIFIFCILKKQTRLRTTVPKSCLSLNFCWRPCSLLKSLKNLRMFRRLKGSLFIYFRWTIRNRLISQNSVACEVIFFSPSVTDHTSKVGFIQPRLSFHRNATLPQRPKTKQNIISACVPHLQLDLHAKCGRPFNIQPLLPTT